MTTPTHSEPPIRVEQHGTIAVLIPSPEAVALPQQPLEQAENAIFALLRATPPAGIVMDLSRVDYFGSRFIGFLVRCHHLAKESGGRMVLAGVSGRIQELLHLAALDQLWQFHADRALAVQALTPTGGQDPQG